VSQIELITANGCGEGFDEIVIVRKRSFFREIGRKQWEGKTKQEKHDFASSGGKSAWASLSPTERSAVMKERAKKRKKKS